jgi:XisH protein
MARDKTHLFFKETLENEGWKVTNDPLYLKMGTIPIHIDLGAEKIIEAEKGHEKIAVEIKTFGNTSFITALYEAVGKYIIYRKALAVLKPDRTLYLAIPDDIFQRIEKEPILKEAFLEECIKLILYKTDIQLITSWIK